jgi:transposase-like protein
MPKEVGTLSIGEKYRNFKEIMNQTLFEDSGEMRLDGLKKMMEWSMLEERERHRNAGWYERCEGRRGYASGYYTRSLLAGDGLISELRVPRVRRGCFAVKVLERYARRAKRIDELIRRMYLNGVSTREVGEVLHYFLGVGVSAATVSRLTKEIDGEVEAFHRRLLGDDYIGLLLDGLTLKSRELGRGEKRLVLVAVGVREDGRWELIDYMPASAESEAEWTWFLNDLYRRGLKGRHLRVITTDGALGLVAALGMVYPRVRHPRCWAHKLRNVAATLPKKHREACLKGARRIYRASSKEKAVKRFWAWASKWRPVTPKAVECLEKDLRALLQFFELPRPLWRKLRTTNRIERAFREVRRRTRPISCFTNDNSLERIIYGVAQKINKRWELSHQRSLRPLFAQKS